MSQRHLTAPSGEGPRIRALVVEDSAGIAALIEHSLEAAGLEVEVVTHLKTARSRLDAAAADVVVLDLELPDGSGLDLFRSPPAVDVPVVIVSSHRAEDDRVTGLELGAADYVVKPFFPLELVARVRLAAERARQDNQPQVMDFGDLMVNLRSRVVRSNRAVVQLTDREFELLAHLAASPDHIFHRDELLRAVWRSSPQWQTPKTVTEHIRRVRRKIDGGAGAASWITTVGRSGYRFEARSS